MYWDSVQVFISSLHFVPSFPLHHQTTPVFDPPPMYPICSSRMLLTLESAQGQRPQGGGVGGESDCEKYKSSWNTGSRSRHPGILKWPRPLRPCPRLSPGLGAALEQGRSARLAGSPRSYPSCKRTSLVRSLHFRIAGDVLGLTGTPSRPGAPRLDKTALVFPAQS